MNDNQIPQGVEITDYVGETGSPHPAHLSASSAKAEAATSPRRGSRAITIWAGVGLSCMVLSVGIAVFNLRSLFIFAEVIDGFHLSDGNDSAGLIAYLLAIASLIISITALLWRRSSRNPGLVKAFSLISIVVVGLMAFVFIDSLYFVAVLHSLS